MGDERIHRIEVPALEPNYQRELIPSVEVGDVVRAGGVVALLDGDIAMLELTAPVTAVVVSIADEGDAETGQLVAILAEIRDSQTIERALLERREREEKAAIERARAAAVRAANRPAHAYASVAEVARRIDPSALDARSAKLAATDPDAVRVDAALVAVALARALSKVPTIHRAKGTLQVVYDDVRVDGVEERVLTVRADSTVEDAILGVPRPKRHDSQALVVRYRSPGPERVSLQGLSSAKVSIAIGAPRFEPVLVEGALSLRPAIELAVAIGARTSAREASSLLGALADRLESIDSL